MSAAPHTSALRLSRAWLGLPPAAALLVLLAAWVRAADPAPTSAPADPLRDSAAGLVGSRHDFTSGGQAPRDLCLPCHTPHITAAQAELLTRGTAQSRAGDQPVVFDDSTLLCLSCHDGITAHDVYATSHAGAWPAELGRGRPRVTSHPVGIRYPTGQPDYHPAAAVTADGRLQLPDGRIQCITCHDPHNTHRHEGMLVISNSRSRLCLTCHQL